MPINKRKNIEIKEKYRSFFEKTDNLIQASSPGRLDVMGGIADYSGSLLLQKTIRELTTATIRLRDDGIIRIRSIGTDIADTDGIFSVPVSSFYDGDRLKEYEALRNDIIQIRGGEWAIYVIGCLYLLTRDHDVEISGVDIFIESDIPVGKGISSSAALEVSVLIALNELFDLRLREFELPIMAQKVENLVVGAPCGLMDQLTSYLGRQNTLLPIRCQPVEVFPLLEIPKGIRFVGVDSGVRHAVSGASYTNVRIAAFMGYTVIAAYEGIGPDKIRQARENGQWTGLPYGGYLANIDIPTCESRYKSILPEVLSGADFLKRYGAIIDPVTQPKPEERYAIRECTAHPVYENARVSAFKSHLEALDVDMKADRHEYLERLGELMYKSHDSYSRCGLGNERTDELVDLVRCKGSEEGLFGAKITGGGSGGTVCILCEEGKGLENAREIGREYSNKYDLPLVFFEGDVDGGFYGD